MCILVVSSIAKRKYCTIQGKLSSHFRSQCDKYTEPNHSFKYEYTILNFTLTFVPLPSNLTPAGTMSTSRSLMSVSLALETGWKDFGDWQLSRSHTCGYFSTVFGSNSMVRSSES